MYIFYKKINGWNRVESKRIFLCFYWNGILFYGDVIRDMKEYVLNSFFELENGFGLI